jgi:hypothetical protein
MQPSADPSARTEGQERGAEGDEQRVDTDTAASKAFPGAFAEFETNLRRERQLDQRGQGALRL